MASKKYLITLTPEGKFFFGNEKTFDSINGSNYFVKSNYFPQQTGILGLIRHQLLIQNNCIPINSGNSAKAEKLIGPHSFRIQENILDFGAINSISPVLIYSEEQGFLYPEGMYYQWVEKETFVQPSGEEEENVVNEFRKRDFIKISENAKCMIGRFERNKPEIKNFIPYLKGFKPKLDLPELLVDSKGNKYNYDFEFDGFLCSCNKHKHLWNNGIFIPEKQVGIRKNYNGNTDDDAFYIQTSYNLIKGYSFAFILDLNTSYKEGSNTIETTFANNQVFFGGEQSFFKMEVKEAPEDFKWPDYTSAHKGIVLLSDSFVLVDFLDYCDFAVTETVDFRFMQTQTGKTQYWHSVKNNKKDNLQDQENKSFNEEKILKSGKYNLLKKGSLLYGDPEIISERLKNNNFYKIGYNHFKTLNTINNEL
jgi:CRISPR-associated protein Cmr3